MATVRRTDSIWVELSYRQVISQQTVEATSGHGTVLLQSHTHTHNNTQCTHHILTLKGPAGMALAKEQGKNSSRGGKWQGLRVAGPSGKDAIHFLPQNRWLAE